MKKFPVGLCLTIAVLGLCAPKAKAENRHMQLEFNEYDGMVLGINMISNGMMGGTGAYLTAHPNANITDFPKMMRSEIYWRGFLQGSIGGSLVYAGEKTMTFQTDYEYSILTGKHLSNLGTSITYSASQNENWLANPSYISDLGPIVFHWKKSYGWKPEVYILPHSLVVTMYSFSQYTFESELSLKTGLLVFSGKLSPDSTIFGVCEANIITMDTKAIDGWADENSSYVTEFVLSHESIHSRWNHFQYMPMDAIYNYQINNWADSTTRVNLNFLRYENQPFRIGADLTSGVFFWSIAKWEDAGGTPQSLTLHEMASSKLFQYVD